MDGICDIPVIADVCTAVGEGTAGLVVAPFTWLAQALGAAAQWMFESVWSLFSQTTLVDITGDNYLGVYNIVFGVALFLAVGFFLLQLIGGMIRRDPSTLATAAIGLGKAIIGSFLVVTITATLLEIVDQLCIGIIQASGNTLESMGDKLAVLFLGLTTISAASPLAGPILAIFLSSLALSAGFVVWFSLLIRKVLLLVAVVLAPIALSGQSWEVTRGWFGKWATFVVALILSKLVVVVIFLIGITQVNSPLDLDLASMADPIAGIVILAIAGFAPYMVYKLISFVGFDMYHAMSTEQEAKNAMNRPLPTPQLPSADTAKKVLDGGNPGTGQPSPDPPPPPPGGPGANPAPAASGGTAAPAAAAPAASTTTTAGGSATAGGSTAAAAGGAAAVAAPVAARPR